MNGNAPGNGQGNSLAYRLRRSVKLIRKEGRPLLILPFPLKYVVLDPFWQPVMESSIRDTFVPIEDLLSLAKGADPDKVEIFLNSMVRRGFLEQRGYAELSVYPQVSVVIPVKDRPGEIRECLHSLMFLDYPRRKIEVIVVDDASQDETPRVVSSFPVRLLSLKVQRQASYCRNLGAREAKGEILAFIDSDCIAHRLWLKELVSAFKDPSVAVVGGRVESYYEDKGLDHYERVKSSLSMGEVPKSSKEGSSFFYTPSCNLLTRKDLFLRLGGFREDLVLGEDVDLCWRIQDQGYHVEYRNAGRVYHRHRNRIKDFCSRRFDYGTSEPLLQSMHRNRIKRLPLPANRIIFFGLALSFLVTLWLPVLGLLGLGLLVDVAASKRLRDEVPISPVRVLLATLRGHFSYCYHLCSFFSRYYLVWSIPMFPFLPYPSLVLLSAHAFVGIVDYMVRRPKLSILLFMIYFTLDQLSYQVGVWWGCVKLGFFRPVDPVIATGVPSRETPRN